MTFFLAGAVIVLAGAALWVAAPKTEKAPVRVRIEQERSRPRR